MNPHAVALIVSLFVLCDWPGTTCRAETNAFAKWEKEIGAFEAADRTNPPPKGALLFIGSSTIRMWKTLAQDLPGHTTINRGFGGSQIVDSTPGSFR